MAQLQSLIGSQISLLSQKNIRYEGTLFQINTESSTISLKDVRCHGTEGRGDVHIEPSDRVYEVIEFSGSDIKDLHVEDKSRAPARPAQQPPRRQQPAPAPRSQAQPPAPQQPHASQRQYAQRQQQPAASAAPPAQKAPPPANAWTAVSRSRHPSARAQQEQQQRRQQQQQQQRYQQSSHGASGNGSAAASRNNGRRRGPLPTRDAAGSSNGGGGANRRGNDGNRPMPGMGNALVNRRVRGLVGSGPEISGDFDFESALGDFSKLEVGDSSLEQHAPAKLVSTKYVKDDFFDTISCDAINPETKVRMTASEERTKNVDTFGAVGLYDNRRRRNRGGRGRGQGRGGRGPGGEAQAGRGGQGRGGRGGSRRRGARGGRGGARNANAQRA